MKKFDFLFRKFIPSAAILSYNPLFIFFGYILDFVTNIFFSEFRQLPPNHLRVRVGVGNKIFLNHMLHMEMGKNFWLNNFATTTLNLKSNILEIGCGCGRMAMPLKSVGFCGQHTGIDIDDEMLNYCNNNFPNSNFTFIKSTHKSKAYHSGKNNKGLLENKFYKIPLESKSQDFIYSTSLLSHLLEDDLINYLSEAFRLLKENGIMRMTFFCVDSMEHNLSGRWTFKHKLGETYVESLKYPEAASAYTKDFIERTCKNVGFREIKFTLTPEQSIVDCKR